MAGGQNVTIKAPKAASIRAMTSAYGRAIPLIYGKGRVQANVIYYTDFVATEHKSKSNAGGKGGGGSQTNINYTYTVCVLFGLAEGVANASLGTLWVGKNKGTASSFGLSYFNGTSTQNPLSYITTNHSSEALSYRGTAYIGAAKFALGDDPSIPSINAEVIGRSSGVNVGTSGSTDANPGDVISDLITDSNTCLGLPSGIVGDLTALRTFCQASGLFVSPVYTEAKPAREMIAALCTIANTGVYFSEGVAKFVPFGDVAITANGTTYTPNLTPAYDLTEDDFLPNGEEPVRVTRKAQADAYNHVKLTYQNRANDYNDDVVEAKDQASIEQNGDRLMSELSLPEIADAAVARKVAQQVLQKSSNIRNTYEFRLSWRFARLEPMDIVTLTESGLGLVAEPVRIIEIEEDDDGFLIKAEEMQVGVLHAATYSTQTSSGYVTDYNVAPSNTNAPVIFEPPASLSGTPQLWIAASGGSNWGGCNVWVSDDNSTYKQVGTLSGKARHGILTAATPSGSSLDTTNTVKVDLTVSGGDMVAGTTQNATDLTTLMYVGGELMAYRDATLTATNKYTLGYLVRGAYGSPIGSHAINDKFARLDETVFHYDYDQKFVGRTIYLKFQSFNVYGGGLQDLSTLTASTYTFAGAQIASVATVSLEQSFVGDSVKVKWGAVDGAVNYTVQVRDGSGATLYRTVSSPDTRFEYTWQDSLADGGPFRSVQIWVKANSKNGASGAFATITASNPVPSALTGLSLTGGYKTVFFQCTPDTSPDVAGYQVWMSTSSGFTPGSGNLIYDGPDPKITTFADASGTALPAAATTYYLRAAAYDKFGKTGLNVSSEFSVTTLAISSGIAPGEITATMIAAGAMDMTKFASGIRPIRNVTSLPTIDGVTYKNGDGVTLTTDNNKLYIAKSGAWDKSVPGADIVTNSITAGQIAVGAIGATQIAANAITADKLFVRSMSAALNDDPNFADATAWTFVGVTQSGGAGGAGVLAVAPTFATCSSGSNQYARSVRKYPVSPSKTYLLTANVYAASGNAREISVNANFFDSAGTLLGAVYSYLGLPATGNWSRCGAQIGASTAKPIPSGATQCDVYVVFQGSGSGSVQQSAQDLRIEEVLGGTLIEDGAITTNKVAANAITAGKIAANTITANEIAANTITGTQIAANTVTATNIDSRNLTIKDASGTVIFSAGTPLTAAYADNALKNSQISIASNGALSGAGGGVVTIGGLGYTGALNATYGATFGSNISGQITSSNASTYIASAAIQAAHIGSLDAAVINAGTITTNKLQVGSVTAASAGSIVASVNTISGSAISWNRDDTLISSFVSTGANPVIYASGYIDASDLGSTVTRVKFTVDILIDGSPTTVAYSVGTAPIVVDPAIPSGTTRGASIPISIAYRSSMSAGSHSIGLRCYAYFYTDTGTVSTTGKFLLNASVVAQENKV